MLQSGVGALPWGHIVPLLDRLADRSTRDWYAARAGSWSRAQLQAAIASNLHEREGAAITNFERTLEAGDAKVVQRTSDFKDRDRRRTKELVAADLPAKQEQTLDVERGTGPAQPDPSRPNQLNAQ